MKTILSFLAVFTLMTMVTLGQITGNEMPGIGDTVKYKGINKNTFDEMTGVTGVGVTWDYHSVYESADTADYYYVDPASTAASSSFPTSTVAEASPGTSGNFYYSQTSNAFYRDGIWDASTIMIPYTNPLKLYALPFQFGTTFTDAYAGVGDMTGGIDSVYINNGSYSFDVQGVGTLFLPTGRFDSVFRVMYQEDFAVKFDLLSPGITIFSISEYGYEYWKPGLVRPVLVFVQTTYDDMQGSHTVSKSVRYNKLAVPDGPYNGVRENAITLRNLYPNPTRGMVNLELDGENNLIEVFDMMGKLMISISSSSDQVSFDMGSFAPGVYQVRVASDDGQTATRKLIVE